MDIFDEKIDELLAKHLAGESSPEEQRAVEHWLAGSPDHRKYLEELQWLWKRSSEGLIPAPRPVDTEQALQRVKGQLKPGGALGWQRGFLLRAAAVFLVFVAAVYWWQNHNGSTPQRIVAAGSVLTDTLTDGSVVTLERGSGLTLTPAFNRRERRLRLQGEAYFAVSHDTTRPFVVEVQELEVRVVGTAFRVDNVTDPSKVTVIVSEGKVLVSHGGQSLLLTPGEQATFDRKSGSLSRGAAPPDQGAPAGKKRIFRFDAAPLASVIQQINEAYGTRISLKNKNLEKCPLRARYNDLPLERVVELIAETFSLRVEKTAGGYVLDGEGCE